MKGNPSMNLRKALIAALMLFGVSIGIHSTSVEAYATNCSTYRSTGRYFSAVCRAATSPPDTFRAVARCVNWDGNYGYNQSGTLALAPGVSEGYCAFGYHPVYVSISKSA
jgi:hypothetical protein